MVVFELSLNRHLAHAVAVASVHGAVDATRPRHLYPYALLLLPPFATHGDLVTACFLAASARHFALDVGVACSAALHVACAGVCAVGAPSAAFALMSVYYCLLHAPLAYVRMVRQQRWVALAAAALLSAACLVVVAKQTVAAEATTTITLAISEAMQRVVVCHILSEESARACLDVVPASTATTHASDSA